MSQRTTFRLSKPAKDILYALASEHRTSPEHFLETLLHYATSIAVRPGSWEANGPFNFEQYLDETGCADKWFSADSTPEDLARVIRRIHGGLA